MPPRRDANYDRKLTGAITLKDGKRLITLQDAANVLLDVFGSVNARGGHVDVVHQPEQCETISADVIAPLHRRNEISILPPQ